LSLKAFHLLFISLAVVLTGGFAVWCVVTYIARHQASMLGLAAGSLVICAALIAYGVRVRRKLKDFSWI
jgi:hypothetical protein